MIEWTDVHTHLNMLKSSSEDSSKDSLENLSKGPLKNPSQDYLIKKIIETAKSQGVTNFINIGTEPEDWPAVLYFTKTFTSVKGALGMHPHSADKYDDTAEELLKKSLSSEGIIACGEIGLDYHYDYSDRKKQKEVFLRQMTLAYEKNLPVEIHTRSAEQDTIEVLEEFKGKVRGLLHCFTGSWSLARRALDLGFNISFSGIITFKKAESLREVCKKTPLDRLHLETDAPYLAPVPNRGKQNQPAWLVYTAKTMADLQKVSLDKLSLQTQNNRDQLFGKCFL